jgi:putative nucleotidyltransferase with HDIG domain
MKLEVISRLKGNEVLGRNIFTNDGRILLRAGTVLNSAYVSKMRDMGVFYVYVEDERLEDVKVEDEGITRLKQNTMESMSVIMKNTAKVADKKIMSEYVKTVEDLISYVSENRDISKSLYDIQTYSNSNFVHSIDVCIMSTIIGHAMRFDPFALRELGVAAILHDIGKTQLPKAIADKTGNLNGEDLQKFKEHPYLGATMLKKNIRISDNIVKAVQQHHERVDGKGYPYGLEGKSIHRFARIICVSDVYDTVTNSKDYKKAFSPNDAYELILAGSGIMFDEEVVKAFRKSFSVYPLGCCVKLSNGVESYVVKQNENFPDRPIVRVLYDPESGKDIEPYEINLVTNINLVITSIV